MSDHLRCRFPDVSPTHSRLRRAAATAITALGLAATTPAQIQLNLQGCYSNATHAPVAVSLDDTTGTGAPLSLVTGHNWPVSPFPTGVDTWGPPSVSGCPVFGGVTTLPFVPAPPLGQYYGVIDVAAAGPQGRFALYRDFPSSYVYAWGSAPAVSLVLTAQQLIAVDFDADPLGLVDLLVLGPMGAIYLSVQTSPGVFSGFNFNIAPPPPIGATAAAAFAVGSFNNDDLPDVVVTWSGTSAQATVLKNVGGTTLATASTNVLGLGDPSALTVGDFDGNGVDDFAVAVGAGDLWVCTTGRPFNWPNLISQTCTLTALPPGTPTAMTNGDYDLDGDLDLAYAHSDGKLRFRPNDSNGQFPGTGIYAEVSYAIVGDITDLETGDIDGDGDPDVASCDWTPGGGTCVWCNSLPVGECRHQFRGGDETDGFAGLDCACPSPDLHTVMTPVREYDDASFGTNFGHTFDDLPGRIRSATLTINWSPPTTGDHLLLGLRYPPANFALDYVETDAVVTLDLARLPGGQNLLPLLNKLGYLDVAGAYETPIDSMKLEIVSYCEDAEPTIDYTHDQLRSPGGIVDFTITAPAYPWGIGFVIIASGVGCPNAPDPYESLCLLPSYSIILVTPLDGSGDGTIPVALPPLPCCLELHSQAMATTTSFTPIGFSPTLTDYVK